MNQVDRTTVAVVGGGPAGLVLGALLARRGVRVTVLEKHADFLRDFRGDTIHPSTLELMHELGWLDGFLRIPHTEMPRVQLRFFGRVITMADFSHLPVACRFIAMMPQWDFLDFIAERASVMPTFELRRRSEVTGLLRADDGRVVGVSGIGPDGPFELRAGLVVGTDGRTSVVRELAGLPLVSTTSDVDALWFRIEKFDGETSALGNIGPGILVALDRGDYWQVAVIVAAGTADAAGPGGLRGLARDGARAMPAFATRVAALEEDDIHLLRVRVDRLRRWHDRGVLCIGDAAHAMSPVGGVGVNLAVQDAIATANLLAEPLRRGVLSGRMLDAVRRRREFPTRVVQGVQVRLMRTMFPRAQRGERRVPTPLFLRIISYVPVARRVTARVIGLGVRRERLQGRPVAAGTRIGSPAAG